MERAIADYLPLVTTALASGFAVVLFRHWRRKPDATYLFWWTLGVTVYGVATLAEAMTTIFGWSEPVFKLWYVTGALMGGVFLAQGTVYLLVRRRTADVLTIILVGYLAVASLLVLLTPTITSAVEEFRLSGAVIGWRWIRMLTPTVNVYAVFWLVGGSAWSAVRYLQRGDGSAKRVWGNVAIAAGALLPAIGGSFAKAGNVELLYVTELAGLSLIWLGYRLIVGDRSPSMHPEQRRVAGAG
jgi:hypothetical protein